MASLLIYSFDTVRETLSTKLAFRKIALLAQNLITSRLERFQTGRLVIWTPDEVDLHFGPKSTESVRFIVQSEEFWVRVLLFADIVGPSLTVMFETDTEICAYWYPYYLKPRLR